MSSGSSIGSTVDLVLGDACCQGVGAEFFDHGDDALDLFVAEHDGVEHLFFRHFLGAGFDHHDGAKVPATDRCMRLSARWVSVGLMMNSSPMRPTLTPAIGPMNGALDKCSAAEAPIMAHMSGSLSASTESTVATI